MHVMLCYHWVTNHCGCCYYNEQGGWTALMYAAEKGHDAIVTYLVEQGANKDLKAKVSIHLLRMIMMMMMMIVYMLLSWWVYVWVHVCMSMYVWVHVCMNVCISIYVWVYMYEYICMSIYIWVYIYEYIILSI